MVDIFLINLFLHVLIEIYLLIKTSNLVNLFS